MPAVTVEDPLTLPAVDHPDPATTTPRPVVSVTSAPSGFEGLGFPVRRAFAGVDRSRLDPFVHMDQMGEVEYAPGEPKGTDWHPHRGFETVTYMIDGTFEHHDSTGGGGLITNGATQWMTAGAGILHIETPPQELVSTKTPHFRPGTVISDRAALSFSADGSRLFFGVAPAEETAAWTMVANLLLNLDETKNRN